MTAQEKRALYECIRKDPTVQALRAANKELCRVMINNPNNARVVRANEQVCSAIQMLKSALKEDQANARLIAAAPETKRQRDELLAALNGMLLVYSEMINNPPYHHTQELWVKVEAAIKLQDAITKAQEGEE
jgi:ferric-dicitrate binding protein FerR (iron transport regulator)